jgi:hypothetical protein
MTVTHADPEHLQALPPAHHVGPVAVEPALVSDDLRRLGFLATLEARTWASRSRAAAVLADPGAVASRAAYAAWLRRVATAWSRVALPAWSGTGRWPFPSVDPQCLDLLGHLRADLRDVTLAAGGVSLPGPAGRQVLAGTGRTEEQAVLAGSVYAAVVLGSDAAVLVPGALGLAAEPRAPLGLRFLRGCAAAAAARTPLRRELARWAEGLPQPEGRAHAELAVRTACDLVEHVADALQGPRRGW